MLFRKMANTYNTEEIELIRESSLLVGQTLAEVASKIAPGIKTIELDKLAENFIRSNGAEPACKGYEGFPYTLCISVNEVVVHGFPSEYVLKDGDIISVDCVILKNGFYGDSAYTFEVGEVDEEVKLFMQATKESLYKGIEQARVGKRVGDIGWAVQSYVQERGYGVVREMCGHGIGRKMHEKPEVPNYGRKGVGAALKKNMVIAIEPMITLGSSTIHLEKNGWGIYTIDRKPSAHYEHTVVITNGDAEILSSFEEIEKVLKSK